MKHEPSRGPRSQERHRAWRTLADSTTIRLAAILGGHEWIKWRSDLVGALTRPRHDDGFRFSEARSDSSYFHHRSLEERQAANVAVGRRARKTHQELAELYADVSERTGKDPTRPLTARRCLRAAAGQSAARQELLLDAALAETFPASDPVSVARVL